MCGYISEKSMKKKKKKNSTAGGKIVKEYNRSRRSKLIRSRRVLSFRYRCYFSNFPLLMEEIFLDTRVDDVCELS